MTKELINGFDPELFRNLIQSKYSSFSASRKPIRLKADYPWESAEQLGIVKSLPGSGGLNHPMIIVAAKLPDGGTLKERSSRIKQFKFAKEVLDTAMSEPAAGIQGVIVQGLFAFYDEAGNFRLSLVYGRAEGKKLVWSAVKRMSFYVEAGDANKTFCDRMVLNWDTFDKLKEAFSVEKLTKEFYNRLFAWYQWALSDEMNVTYPNDTDRDDDDREINDHIIRLITRLMFVWFLKQKHLVPVNLFDPAALKGILKQFNPVEGDNYYRAILQNLFFATLNSEIPDRAFAVDAGYPQNKEHFDIKTLYRYGKEFAISQKEVLELFKPIPFLNGGLFECLDKEKNYCDGFSRNPKKQAHVPNQLFFDADKGLIPLLNQYNFTVEENSPGDEEVALDPELLGKVFENLLGAYIAETDIKKRNSTGSFYTPREIVNYMVDESLIAHLTGKCGNEHENAIRDLFSDGTKPESGELCDLMDKALTEIKILDPACGSGAFPMGILLRMVEVLRVIRGIGDDQPVYDLKLELIENCIYGGDIQCIAVQISKLRFFISLVCEQKPTKNADKNYGINTLPNLETKFVAADSLIGLQKPDKKHNENMVQVDLFSEDEHPEIKKLKNQLWDVRHKHFCARNRKQKLDLRAKDEELRKKLADTIQKIDGYSIDAAHKMADWNPYDQNTSAKWSDPEWMFNVKNGFDVVIGNPPYLRIQGLRKTNPTLANKLVQLYEAASGSFDIYAVFAEKGLSLIKNTGLVNFIMPVKWLNAAFGKGLRTVLLNTKAPWKIINFGAYPVFNASTYTGLQWFKPDSKTLAYFQLDKNLTTNDELGDYLQTLNPSMAAHVPISNLDTKAWILNVGKTANILENLNQNTRRISDIFEKIFQGLATSKDDVYFLSDCRSTNSLTKGYSKFLSVTVEIENGLLKPLLKGEDVHRYENISTTRTVVFPYKLADGKASLYTEKELKEKFPKGYIYLKRCEAALRGRERGRLKDDDFWYRYIYPKNLTLFSKEKLIAPDISLGGNFSYDKHGEFYSTTTLYGYIKKAHIQESYKVLLALLNSKLCWWFLLNTGTVLANGYFRFKPDYINPFPVPEKIPEVISSKIESKVDGIISEKKIGSSVNTSALEAEIDKLVYKLYDLTDEEIAIVEKSVKQSKRAEPEPKPAKAKKTAPKKKKADLPPSLPGWD